LLSIAILHFFIMPLDMVMIKVMTRLG
jgi:uncharacterized membrane protein